MIYVILFIIVLFIIFSTDSKTDENIMWSKKPNINSETITISKNEN